MQLTFYVPVADLVNFMKGLKVSASLHPGFGAQFSAELEKEVSVEPLTEFGEMVAVQHIAPKEPCLDS